MKPEQIKALKDLESRLRTYGDIPRVKKLGHMEYGMELKGEYPHNNIIALGLALKFLYTLPESIGNLSSLEVLILESNHLKTLPESIGNLSSLKRLDLRSNQLTTLPESIGNLSSLKELWLENYNRLTTLPESIGKLTSLEELNLGNNRLSTLPESIGNLSSLKELSLKNNELTTLPVSLWRCKNLESLDLNNNPWEGKWKGIDVYDVPKVLEFCRQRAPISVFISHSKGDEGKYCVIKFMEILKKSEEIRKIYSSGALEIPESQLLLFIATRDSITDTQCRHELGLALTHDIRIIPIKGTDITFEDLQQIDLNAEGHGYFNLKDKKGFEFDGDEAKYEEFCSELYEYIKQYKRDFNLFDAEARKFDEERQNVRNMIKKLIKSEEIRGNLMENFIQLDKISEELKTGQISAGKYILKTGQIFKPKSK
ncbi:MAG: leucine-rich repeat domain-containing protein [Promethearchaeota archaeon]